MSSPISRRRLGVLAGLGLLAATATACSNSDPLASGTPAASGTLVVGSQQYYSNEIIAELYAQSLAKLDVAAPQRRLLEIKLMDAGGTVADPAAEKN